VVYVTENGLSVPGESAMPLAQALNDQERIDYLKVRLIVGGLRVRD
jgi:beta-glucosidase/6-phospho-beta-glucosidase/beta-galactosidase